MRNGIICFTSLVEAFIIFIATAPLVKKMNGSIYRLVCLFPISLIRSYILYILIFDDSEPHFATTAYAAIISDIIYIAGLIYSLKNIGNWSIPIIFFGFSILVTLLIEIPNLLILHYLGFLDIKGGNYWISVLYSYLGMLFLTILLMITVYPIVYRYLAEKIEILKNYSMLVINALFVFALFKQQANYEPNYPFVAANLLLFLTISFLLFRELTRSDNSNELVCFQSNLQNTIEPIINKIEQQHVMYRTQLGKIDNLLRKNETYTTDDENILSTDWLKIYSTDLHLILDNTILDISNQELRSLIYIKSREASAYGIEFQTSIMLACESFTGISVYALNCILSNLIDNAIEASREFTGIKKVTVFIDYKPELLLLSVSNTGNPLPDNIIKQIYRRGFTTKEKNTNELRGYGLYNVKMLVNQQKGKIDFIANNGINTFYIEIPQII